MLTIILKLYQQKNSKRHYPKKVHLGTKKSIWGRTFFGTLMAHFIFKEKMNLKGVFGITIAFVALLIMNMM